MNKVILVGRLTKDPEIRATQTGKKIASFSVAVDDGKNQSGERISQYFNCTAWEQQAELFEQYIKKGHRVAIVGKLQNRSWDKPDGSKGYATDVLVREIEMLTTRAEADMISSSDMDSAGSSSSPNSSNSKAKPSKSQKSDSSEPELPEIDVDSINVQMPF